MADNLTLTQNGQVMMAMRADLAAPWWEGMTRDGIVLTAPRFAVDATMAEAWAAAGMEWEALALRPFYTLPDGRQLNADACVIIRSDTGEQLGMMGAGYHVHTQEEIRNTFQRLCTAHGGGGWKLRTLGALKGAAIIWAQAERGEVAEVIPGDYISRRVMLQTSFDGSQPTGCADGETRIVCDNTRRANWSEATKKATQRHRSRLDGSALMRRAGIKTGQNDAWANHIAALRVMADASVTDGQARDLLRAILEPKAKPEKAPAAPAPATPQGDTLADLLARPASLAVASLDIADKRDPRALGPILHLFNGAGQGSMLEGAKGTRYGLLQAVTEYVDHWNGRNYDTGRTSAFFGQGAALKDRAFQILAADGSELTA